LAAFYAEPVHSCGGHIVLPPGYLAAAYEQVRAAGGVCIADEVQVGLGRVGSHLWAFETQGVVPDIVTLGKPLGNGHPLAAVVTTSEIAASFHNGMEYFNTFGGNPVSAAIGLAVLDVLKDERLQQNAQRMGERLMSGLRELALRQPLIGDVRGLGLFLGVELVRDRETREPAAREAALALEIARRRGVLLATEGPRHNVLKMKPPIAIRDEHCDLVLSVLAGTLDEVADLVV
jgi:4-aminobutyrate aminotransferase-like enzyme